MTHDLRSNKKKLEQIESELQFVSEVVGGEELFQILTLNLFFEGSSNIMQLQFVSISQIRQFKKRIKNVASSLIQFIFVFKVLCNATSSAIIVHSAVDNQQNAHNF